MGVHIHDGLHAWNFNPWGFGFMRVWIHEGLDSWGWIHGGLHAWGFACMRVTSMRGWIHEGLQSWGFTCMQVASMRAWVHEGLQSWGFTCMRVTSMRVTSMRVTCIKDNMTAWWQHGAGWALWCAWWLISTLVIGSISWWGSLIGFCSNESVQFIWTFDELWWWWGLGVESEKNKMHWVHLK